MKHTRWIAVCAALWLSACCSTLHRPDEISAVRRAAAVNTRWIATTQWPHLGCPNSGTADWTVRPLVQLDRLRPALRTSVREAKLDRFCVYEYHGRQPKPELPWRIVRLLDEAGPDRIAMTASADGLEGMIWQTFYDRFLDQVHPIGVTANGQPASIRLAFLDSQPTGDGVATVPPGLPDHGYAMTNIAGDLVRRTQGESPYVHIGSRQALPLVGFGARGTYTDLANAIIDEINDWHPTDPGSPQHLVLNLSLGWDGEIFEGWNVNSIPPEVQPVYSALQTAAAQHVLVIAAAGNELSGPDPAAEPPLLPGGWQSLGLAYAVSGVDGQGHPLVNTRQAGEAQWAAYADHVAVPDFNGAAQHTPTLTGSSVATAVVSTAAALVWSYRPELTLEEVMSHLYGSASDLGRPADFPAPTPGNVRRVSLCGALSAACGQPGARCSAVNCSLFQSPVAISLVAELYGHAGFTDGGTVGPSVPDQFQNLLSQPLVGSQPGADPCPNCVVSGPPDAPAPMAPSKAGFAKASFRTTAPRAALDESLGNQLWIDIPSDWSGATLSAAALDVFSFPGNSKKQLQYSCSLNWPPPDPALPLEVTDPLCGAPIAGGIQARLRFTFIPPAGSPLGPLPLTVDSPLYVEH